MKKILVAVLFLMVIATPAFAAKKQHSHHSSHPHAYHPKVHHPRAHHA